MNRELVNFVRTRAGHSCEYCRLPAALFFGTFEIEHIVARKHRGGTVAGNLAYACAHCNKHKGSDLAGYDRWRRRTPRLTRLFDPRRHVWAYHFRFDGPFIEPRTAIGRVTEYVLALNGPIQIGNRTILIDEGTWSPG